MSISRDTQQTESLARSFFEFPGEVRNIIYGFILSDRNGIVDVEGEYEGPCALRVNRQFNHEYLGVYLTTNIFLFGLRVSLSRWIEGIGAGNLLFFKPALGVVSYHSIQIQSSARVNTTFELRLVEATGGHQIEIRHELMDGDPSINELVFRRSRQSGVSDQRPYMRFSKFADPGFAELLACMQAYLTDWSYRIFLRPGSSAGKCLASWAPQTIVPSGGVRACTTLDRFITKGLAKWEVEDDALLSRAKKDAQRRRYAEKRLIRAGFVRKRAAD